MKIKDLASALNGALVFFKIIFLLLFLASCSHKSLSLFFDMPPPKAEAVVSEQELRVQQTKKTTGSAGNWEGLYSADLGVERPPIEDVLNWEEVLEILPKDYKKKADWSAAIEQNLIRPRTGADPTSQFAAIFQYDFIMANEKPKNEAYFPHSSHTMWLGCKNCHVSLYPYKRNPATMKEMRAGASCGACHGKVAFSLRQCKRCHLKR